MAFSLFNKASKTVDNMLRSLLSVLICLLTFNSFAEGDPKSRYTRSQYIDMWSAVAMEQMREHGIPASITLAQAILESGDGNSMLARDANNHFGIKCHGWTGQKVYHDDDARNECFRKYKNARESFHDHSEFLKRQRYAFLFDYDITDYKSWAKGLKKAGYATNPKYPDLLIRLIEENQLVQYDKMALKKGPIKSAQSRSQNHHSKGQSEIVVTLGSPSQVKVSENRIKYVETQRSETIESLASKHHMGRWQIRRYNDLDKGASIEKGERIYLQPKRNKAAKAKVHVVQHGETIRDISQKYGVKIKKLLKRSGFDRGYEVQPGDKIILQ